MNRTALAGAAMLIASGCDLPADGSALAEGASRGALSGHIDCALGGATSFSRTCTIEEMQGGGALLLVVGRSDSGYRRLRVTADGRGVQAADGAQEADVVIVGQGLIEIAIGADRYRLPASTGAK